MKNENIRQHNNKSSHPTLGWFIKLSSSAVKNITDQHIIFIVLGFMITLSYSWLIWYNKLFGIYCYCCGMNNRIPIPYHYLFQHYSSLGMLRIGLCYCFWFALNVSLLFHLITWVVPMSVALCLPLWPSGL